MNSNPLFNTKTPVLNEGTIEEKRAEILCYFHKTFDIDEQLFECFSDQKAMYVKADPLRHPLIFYYGHTATFYINKLIISKVIFNRIDPKLESMFAIGVDEMSWDDLDTSHYDWPTVDEVLVYRNKVRKVIDELIKSLTFNLPIGWDSPFWIILMGIEHERIHLETSSVLIRQLPIACLKPIKAWQICEDTGPAPENSLLPVQGATIRLGKSFDSPIYGWDNEYGKNKEVIQSFNASRFLCSNGEYKQFVDANGYGNQVYWTEEGWNWRTYRKAEHPLFWIPLAGGWKLRLVYTEIQMPWNWPVEVNYLEAKAFCNWKTEHTGFQIRLPSEGEWSLLRQNANIPDQPYWDLAPGNINMEHFQSPCPVDRFNFNGFYDIIGNVWQWTETPISGFNGFKVHPVYDDFSTPTFDLKHNLIKGGSWISTGNEATTLARYAFRRHFYQHAGFRFIESKNDIIFDQNIYESDPEVVRHCEAQYGGDFLGIKNYYEQIANVAIQYAGVKKEIALDLGCRCGKTTWELAKSFDQVTGLDFTARNIRVAVQLQEQKNFKYLFPEEGELQSYNELTLSDLGYCDLIDKVRFQQSDASNMKSTFIGYDLVLLNDILDQMYNPRHFLQSVHKRINPGGRLIVATGYDWSEQCTSRNNWVGGYRQDGEQIWGENELENLLHPNFTKIAGPFELPSVKRINKRKFSYNTIEVTIWEKKEI